MQHVQNRQHFRPRRLNHSGVGGGIYGEDALSKLLHTATVCVAGLLIDPNPNRFVDPNFFHCMLPSPLCGIFDILGRSKSGHCYIKLTMSKTTFSQTPTFLRVCPWDLLMVIANATLTGNCRLLHSNGNSLSFGRKVTLGIKTDRF